MMTKRSSLLQLALLVLLLGGCRPAGSAAEGDAAGEDCSMDAWSSTLELGLRRDEESARRLAEMKFGPTCALEIRKLAEVLLDDRVAEHQQHPERAAKVRFKDPDLRGLHIKKQPSVLVVLELTIDATGRVTHAQFVQPHPEQKVNDVFLETARGWLFRPAREGAAWRESKQSLSANIHFR